MKCTDKEWQHCRVEKMGCKGCYYDEIEITEFVSTKCGHIFKVDNEKKVLQGLKFLDAFYGEIIKHSTNITDLIQEGDILEIKEGNDICYLGLEKGTITVNYNDIKEDIKKKKCELLSILTKEQYQKNCFKVGD